MCVCLSFGALVEVVLAWLLIPVVGWRGLLLASSLPLFVVVCLFPSLPESPRFLALHGRLEAAKSMINKVSTQNRSTLHLHDWTLKASSLGVHSEQSICTSVSNAISASVISELTCCWDQGRTFGVEVADTILGGKHVEVVDHVVHLRSKLMAKPFRSTLTLRLASLTALVYYGYVFIAPRFFTKVRRLQSTAEQTPNGDCCQGNKYLDIFISTVAEFPGLLIPALCIDRIGRRPTLFILFSTTSVVSALLLLSVTPNVDVAFIFAARMVKGLSRLP